MASTLFEFSVIHLTYTQRLFIILQPATGVSLKFYLKCALRASWRWPSEQTISSTIRCLQPHWHVKRRRLRRIWDFGTEITSNGCSSCHLSTWPNKGDSHVAHAANNWRAKTRIRLTKPFQIKAKTKSLGAKKSVYKCLPWRICLAGDCVRKLDGFAIRNRMAVGIWIWIFVSIYHQFPRGVRFNWFARGDCIIMCVPRRKKRKHSLDG